MNEGVTMDLEKATHMVATIEDAFDGIGVDSRKVELSIHEDVIYGVFRAETYSICVSFNLKPEQEGRII